MALRDLETELSTKQSIVGAAGTINSTHVYDTRLDLGDVGVGQPTPQILFTIDEAVAGGSVSFQLQTSDSETFASGNVTAAQSPVIAPAALKRGAEVVLAIPYGMKRYFRAQYVISGASTTTGKVTAGVVINSDRTRKYPSGWNF